MLLGLLKASLRRTAEEGVVAQPRQRIGIRRLPESGHFLTLLTPLPPRLRS